MNGWLDEGRIGVIDRGDDEVGGLGLFWAKILTVAYRHRAVALSAGEELR